MKIYAMVPCRLGSQRVPKKNLRLLGGKTLSHWVAATCKKAQVFDEIYINSESEIFNNIAREAGVKFYKRNPSLASNNATNDDFALDFMNSFEFDVLVQVNPTSPFTSVDDLRQFVDYFRKHELQTLHAVKEERIEGLFNGRPLNFDPRKQMPPSQLLVPVQVFCSSIMAWDVKQFRKNMRNLRCAVYGGEGKIGYFPLKGFSTLDIDNEEDFLLAEAIISAGALPRKDPEYYEI